MTAKLVIFDCDGVLVDSEPIAARVLAEALVELGLDVDPREVDDRFRGRSLADIIVEVEAELGRAVPADFLPRLNEVTRRAFETSLQPVEGVRLALETIAQSGVDLCVASSGSPSKIHHSLGLTGLISFFEDRIFSAHQVDHGKPAPDLFQFAARQMGRSSEESIVVEDSIPGVTGAVAAGATVLGYCSPQLPNAEIHALALAGRGAQVFDSMAELPHLVSALLRTC